MGRSVEDSIDVVWKGESEVKMSSDMGGGRVGAFYHQVCLQPGGGGFDGGRPPE